MRKESLGVLIALAVAVVPVFAAEPQGPEVFASEQELYQAAEEAMGEVVENETSTAGGAEVVDGNNQAVIPDTVDTLTVGNLIVNNVEPLPYVAEPRGGVYPGRISRDVVSMFAGVGNLNKGYVLYRATRESYKFVVGDVKETNGHIDATGEVWTYNSETGTIDGPHNGAASIDQLGGVVYSSVGLKMYEREVLRYAQLGAFSVLVMFVFIVVRGIMH